ncbi:MAG TPA: hypothetical protein VHU86_03325 [Solirubrobacterales bacterium]|jgi:hypothetical protein|nr:hypothetical protein [Solirubrobacterales bacterium]
MFALECAALLSRRLSLLHESIDQTDQAALLGALKNGRHPCPEATPEAASDAIENLLERAERTRLDQLMGLWAIAARDDVPGVENGAQGVWLAQLSRRLLPRRAIELLLGLDRDGILGLIGCDRVVEEERKQRQLGLCDNHLHSGAADELGDLLERLVPRVIDLAVPVDLATAAGSTSSGIKLNAAPVVLALAAACTVLGCPDNLKGYDEQLLADVKWWKSACELAQEEPGPNGDQFSALRGTVKTVADKNRVVPKLSALYAAIAEEADGANHSPVRSAATRRGLVALCVLYDLIVVPPGSDLGDFVRRFDLMRTVRGLFGEDRGRLGSALRTMYTYGKVTGMELRKSVVPSSEHTISVAKMLSSIEKDIKEHASSALTTCNDVGNDELVVRMPITFTRRNVKPVDLLSEPNDYVPFRPPIGETMAVADAIVQATADERRARFVGAVDVVGDEKKVPNWLYALAYQRIASESSLEFTCHAGEYFADSMEGLRRIGEAALAHPAEITRIGHCLSLGVTREAQSGVNKDAGVLLENAIWALLVLNSRADLRLNQARDPAAPEALKSELKRAMLQLARHIFDTDVGVYHLCDWYLHRFDLAQVSRWVPGLRELVPSRTTSWPRGASRWTLPEPLTLADAMLGSTIYEMDTEITDSAGTQRVHFTPMVDHLPFELVSRLRRLLNEAKPFAATAVRDWLVSRKIVIESCPSSNAALADISIDRHPIWNYHNERLICSINTDDPALFGAALNEEYVHAGMLANEDGGDGASFLGELAETSRTFGTIQRPLCGPTEKPADAYRAVLNSMGSGH